MLTRKSLSHSLQSKTIQVRGLRKLYDEVETSVKNLRALNVDTSTYGFLLVPLLKEKLSPDLRLRLSRNFENEVWALDNMLEMLKLEVL